LTVPVQDGPLGQTEGDMLYHCERHSVPLRSRNERYNGCYELVAGRFLSQRLAPLRAKTA
jgi:hypothetical protein